MRETSPSSAAICDASPPSRADYAKKADDSITPSALSARKGVPSEPSFTMNLQSAFSVFGILIVP